MADVSIPGLATITPVTGDSLPLERAATSLLDRRVTVDALKAFAQAGLATVATTGAYADVTGKPTLSVVATSGAYSDVIGTPVLASVATVGTYASLTAKPTLATVAGTGAYSDLISKPTLATVATSGLYADLSGKPALGTVAALTGPGGTALFLRSDDTYAAPPGAGNSLWSATTFATNVLLSGASFMPSQNVSSVIAFTPNGAGAAAGASNYIRLVADGTNVPTFVGFTEHGSSAGYDNRASYPNWVTFWFDGITYWHSIQQAAVPTVIDTIAPTFVSAAVANATPAKIVITYSKALSPTLTGAITVGGTANTVVSQTVVGATVEVVVNSAYVNGNTITVTVPAGCVKDSAGNAATALAAQTVANNVGVVDVTPPVLSTATIANASPTVVTLTYNKALTTAPVPATSAFSIGGTVATAKTISSVAISGSVVSVTVSSAFVSTDAPTITYTVPASNPIKDVAGNVAAALTAQTVTNGVTAATFMRFLTNQNATESGNATSGWVYASTAAFGAGYCSGPSKTLPASTDGSWTGKIVTLATTTNQSGLGLKATSAVGYYGSFDYAIFVGSGVYRLVTAGSGGGTPNTATVTPAVNDLIRLRRVGTTLYGEISKDGGTSFTVIQVWTGVTTAQLWPIINDDTGQSFGPFTSIGMT